MLNHLNEQGFHYMINKKASSGGGAVPSFDWHIFDEDESLWIAGIRITPLPGELKLLQTSLFEAADASFAQSITACTSLLRRAPSLHWASSSTAR
jgi:hypothetical protein